MPPQLRCPCRTTDRKAAKEAKEAAKAGAGGAVKSAATAEKAFAGRAAAGPAQGAKKLRPETGPQTTADLLDETESESGGGGEDPGDATTTAEET